MAKCIGNLPLQYSFVCFMGWYGLYNKMARHKTHVETERSLLDVLLV